MIRKIGCITFNLRYKMQKRKSIFISRLVYSYSIVIIIMVCMFFISFYYYTLKTSEKISVLNQQELADKTIKQIDSFLDDMDYVSYQVMTNVTLLNTFNSLQNEKQSNNYFDENILLNIDTGSILTTINGPKKLMWRISLYNQFGDYISSGATTQKENIINVLNNSNVHGDMLDLMHNANKINVLHPQADKWSNIYSSKYITVKRPLMNIYSKEVYGIVEVQQDIKMLIEKIEFSDTQNINILITDKNGNQVFSNFSENIKEIDMILVSKNSLKYEWTVTLFQKKSDMILPYIPLINAILVGSIGLMILMIAVVFFIARKLGKPLIVLKNTVSKINIQNMLQTDTSHDNIDEVRELNIAFLAMLNRLSDTIALEKKAHLMALQSQMNPHFLYNTLAVISAVGSEAGNDKVVKLCNSLTSILRYVSYYEETTVTLNMEIENVTCYLELMKGRYEDDFSYNIEVDESVREIRVPKLILQPLAENCFKHGFDSIEPHYTINISIGVENEKWYIRIADNGSGFTGTAKEQVYNKVNEYWNSLNQNKLNMKTEGIGLINTIIRLKLNTGKEIDYSIEDNNPNGSIITIWGEIV